MVFKRVFLEKMVLFTGENVILGRNVVMRKEIYLALFLFSGSINAEIKVYQDTDNTGTSKYERIGIIEKYLIDLSSTLKVMEVKLEANTLKLKTLSDVVTAMKDKDLKNLQDQMAEKKAAESKDPNKAEIEKLKADILSMKNDDIDKMKTDLDSLRFAIKQLK